MSADEGQLGSSSSKIPSRNVELEDLVAAYPDSDSRDFQGDLASRKEFRELRTNPYDATIRMDNGYFKHQNSVIRYLRMYDKMMLMFDTGMGKTCTFGGAAEFLKKEDTNIRHVIVLVNNKIQKDEITKQLACVCSGEEYIDDTVRTAQTEAGQKRSVNANMRKWYTVKTFIGFNNMIRKKFKIFDGEATKWIEDTFSDCLFILDEIQMIRINEYIDSNSTKKDRQRMKVYTTIWLVLHIAQRIKVVVSSATPIMEKVTELITQLNLILDMDKQIGSKFMIKMIETVKNLKLPVTLNKLNISKCSIDELANFVQGNIAYIRAVNKDVMPNYRGKRVKYEHRIELGKKKINVKSQLTTVNLEMSNHQKKAYIKSLTNKIDEKGNYEIVRKSGWRHEPRRASCWTYPDGTWGTAGYKNHFKEQGTNVVPTTDYARYLSKPDNVKKISVIGHAILQGAINEPGKRYVYTPHVKGSGAYDIGAMLEQYSVRSDLVSEEARGKKFKRFDSAISAFETSGDILRPYCGGDQEKRSIRSDFPKAPRYAIITETTGMPEKAAIFELFNSKENVNGDYIKVIIITPVGQYGINLFDIMHVDILAPEWTPSAIYQAIMRAFRIISHVYTLQEYQMKNLGEDVVSNILKVNVNRYVAYYKQDGETKKAIQHNMYLYMEQKDIEIKRVIRMLKMLAFDCEANKECNIAKSPEGIDGSPECDFQKCEYKCYSEFSDNETVYDTYDVFYASTIIEETMKRLQTFWYTNSSGTAEFIVSVIPEILNPKYITMTVEYMNQMNLSFYDRYGISCYPMDVGGVYFLSRRHSRFVNSNIVKDEDLQTIVLNGYYSNKLTTVLRMSMDEVSIEYEKENMEKVIRSVLKLEVSDEDFSNYVSGLNYNIRAALFEEAILIKTDEQLFQELSSERRNRVEKIINFFNNVCIKIHEPVSQFQQVSNTISQKVKQRLQINPNESEKIVINLGNIGLGQDKQNEIVYVHNMYIGTGMKKMYGLVSRVRNVVGRLRIFKKSEGYWRDPNEYEEPVYQVFFRKRVQEHREELSKKYNIYGMFIAGGKEFHIVDEHGEKRIERACKTYTVVQLLEIMFILNIDYGNAGYDDSEYEHTEERRLNKVKNLYHFLERNVPMKIIMSWKPEFILYAYNFFISFPSTGVAGRRDYKGMMCVYISSFMYFKDMIQSHGTKEFLKNPVRKYLKRIGVTDTKIGWFNEIFETMEIKLRSDSDDELFYTHTASSMYSSDDGSDSSGKKREKRKKKVSRKIEDTDSDSDSSFDIVI